MDTNTHKISLGVGIVNYPMPVALVGTRRDGRDNFMTVAWLSMVSHTPPKIAISLGKHATAQYIHETGVFSINFPTAEQLLQTDYCGLTSADKTDKSGIFHIFTEQTGAPMIADAPLTVECRLDHIDANGQNETFIGTIAGVYADPEILTDGKVDLQKLNPLLLSQLDTRYYQIGTSIGRAWRDGLQFHPSPDGNIQTKEKKQ